MYPNCLVCNERLQIDAVMGNSDMRVDCLRCGSYRLSENAALTLPHARNIKRHILSAIIKERGLDVGIPFIADLEAFQSSVRPPHGPIEAMERLLLYLYKQAETADSYVGINEQYDFPITYSKTPGEFNYLLKTAIDDGLIHRSQNEGIRLTLKGWERADYLQQKQVKSDQAFVAMHFDESLKEVWRDGFYEGLKDAGYVPIRIDKLEHNEMINDRMMAEIRRSGLVVADCTGQRHNVYFEAGFA